jgi:hypothetical protein
LNMLKFYLKGPIIMEVLMDYGHEQYL